MNMNTTMNTITTLSRSMFVKMKMKKLFNKVFRRNTYLYVDTAMYPNRQHKHNIKVLKKTRPGQKVYLEIDSNGGNLDVLRGYAEAIDAGRGRVQGIIKKAYSAAYMLSRHVHSAQAAEDARIMIHMPQDYVRRQYSDGRIEDISSLKTGQELVDAVETMEPYIDILTLKERLRFVDYEDIHLTGKEMHDRIKNRQQQLEKWVWV